MTREVADFMKCEVEKAYDMPAMQVLGVRMIMHAKYELEKMNK